jgi:NAD(P)-dependent dehydrogenase (short-subunit alcohol dehydrogenase family)
MREVLDLNVLGALLSVKAAIPRLSVKHGAQGGAMVLVSSMAASLGGPGEYVWYAASKGAIDSMTIGLSKELAGDNIRVNALAPGLIATEIHPPGRLDHDGPCGHGRGGRRLDHVPVVGGLVLHHRHHHARRGRAIEHDPEKWAPVFGKDHAPTYGLINL